MDTIDKRCFFFHSKTARFIKLIYNALNLLFFICEWVLAGFFQIRHCFCWEIIPKIAEFF
ncbi:hypothetical protein DESC_90024 [Desulfosarcina cetonica]|nr:hypothetical protein DESC_90024 [Desulfosarcina cetonica]